MPRFARSLSLFAAASLLLLGGCSQRAKEARAVARGNRYFDAGQYDAAEIEYLSALRVWGRDPEAIAHLAIIYFDQGRMGSSFPLLSAARELEPDNLDVRVKYGLFLLSYGEYQKARDEANYILDHKPDQKDAPLLLVEASIQSKDVEAARQKLSHLPPAVVASAPVLVAFGMLDFRQHQYAPAEAKYRQALALDPKYSSAYTALGALYWAKSDLPNAAIAFQHAAEFAAQRSQKLLQYAQFKIQTGDRAGGRKMLEDIVQKTPDFVSAAMLLAGLDEDERRYQDGEEAIQKVLVRDPTYPDALLLSGRLLLAAGETQRAVTELERAQKYYPNYPQIGFELGRAYLAAGSVEKATFSLEQAIRQAPEFAEAIMLLAQVKMQKGDMAAATLALRQFIEKRPDYLPARYALARAYLAQHDAPAALDLYQQVEAQAPHDAEPYRLAGLVYLSENAVDQGRQQLEKSLTIDPDHIASVEDLVDLDIGQHQFAAARQLVDQQLARNKSRAQLLVMRGRVLVEQKEMKAAEADLREAIQIEPTYSQAYYVLAELYFTTHQEKAAVADLQQEVAKDPRALTAWMLMGAILNENKDYTGARQAYEKVLAVDPNFSAALNDLSYLYAENFGLLDQALDLAQRARKLLPNEPHVADTLGWVLYKQGKFDWALSLLQEAVSELPEEPDPQYHLGMTEYMLGQVGPAQQAFQNALKLNKPFDGIEDARTREGELAVDVDHAGAAETAILEKAAAARPNDPVVLTRLATVYERSHQIQKAIDTCNQALKTNPENVPALTLLSRMELQQGDVAGAFSLAKSARRLAPTDPQIASLAGRLAYLTGDYAWALTLLTEAAGNLPNDREVLYDSALAAYSEGQVQDAQSRAEKALQINGAPFSRAQEAQRFLQLLPLAANPTLAASQANQVKSVLAATPNNVPALMAEGAIDSQKGDSASAKADYEAVLRQYPDFFPARRPLVILTAETANPSQALLDLAVKAREAYPNDPEVAEACGIIAYGDAEYARCESLLKESAAARPPDAKLMYYLGMAQFQLKEKESKGNLQTALNMKLRDDLSAQAKKTITALK